MAISLSYSALEDAKSFIDTTSGEMESALSDLEAKLDPIPWVGADKEAYQEAKNTWNTAFTNLNEILRGISNSIENAKIRYQEQEAANAARFSA